MPPPDLFGVKKDDDSVSCACCCVDWAHVTTADITTDITDSNGVFVHACFTGLLGAVRGRYCFTSVFVWEFLEIKEVHIVLMCSVYS